MRGWSIGGQRTLYAGAAQLREVHAWTTRTDVG